MSLGSPKKQTRGHSIADASRLTWISKTNRIEFETKKLNKTSTDIKLHELEEDIFDDELKIEEYEGEYLNG